MVLRESRVFSMVQFYKALSAVSQKSKSLFLSIYVLLEVHKGSSSFKHVSFNLETPEKRKLF